MLIYAIVSLRTLYNTDTGTVAMMRSGSKNDLVISLISRQTVKFTIWLLIREIDVGN